MLPGHGVLLPGRNASATPNVGVARGRRLVSGLVPIPGPGLLPAADDGRRSVHLGRQEPPQELHSHDRLQGRVIHSVHTPQDWSTRALNRRTSENQTHHIHRSPEEPPEEPPEESLEESWVGGGVPEESP